MPPLRRSSSITRSRVSIAGILPPDRSERQGPWEGSDRRLEQAEVSLDEAQEPGVVTPLSEFFGTGWYRKRFTAPASKEGKYYSIEFDGVMSNSKGENPPSWSPTRSPFTQTSE